MIITKRNINLYSSTKAFGEGGLREGEPAARFSLPYVFCLPFFKKRKRTILAQQNFVLYKQVLLSSKQGILRYRDSYDNADLPTSLNPN